MPPAAALPLLFAPAALRGAVFENRVAAAPTHPNRPTHPPRKLGTDPHFAPVPPPRTHCPKKRPRQVQELRRSTHRDRLAG